MKGEEGVREGRLVDRERKREKETDRQTGS